jgi:putative SOS response-associated peptidase YedK
MCGRLDINRSICQVVSDTIGTSFTTSTNNNLCPSESVATIIKPPSGFQQLETHWGIKPSWSNNLLINVQAETVSTKNTFQQSFATRRCLVPCSGWYEWRLEGIKKVKYTFTHANNEPLYMAGIWYENDMHQLVTLTTSPNSKCAEYHKRMPVFVLPENIDYWFSARVEELSPLLKAIDEDIIDIFES